MSRKRPLVVAFKSTVDGAIRGVQQLAQSVSGVARGSEQADAAQARLGKTTSDSAKEAAAAMKRLGVKMDTEYDAQIGRIEKNRDALKRLRDDNQLTADEYVRAMKVAEAKIAMINASIGRDTRTRNERMRESFSKIGKGAGAAAGAGAVGAGAVAGLGLAASQEYIERAQAIKRAAAVSGESVEDIQALGYAFESMGFDVESAGDMIKDFNEKLGEGAQVGSGGIADFVEQLAPRLGLVKAEDVEDADGIKRAVKQIFGDKQGIEAMKLYVYYLDQANLSQKEYTSYLEAMVSDSTALLPLLRDGGKELKALIAAAQASGGLFDEKDIENAEKLRQSTAALKAQWQGMFLDGAEEGGGFSWIVDQAAASIEKFRIGVQALRYYTGGSDQLIHDNLMDKATAKHGSEVTDKLKSTINLVIGSEQYPMEASKNVADQLVADQNRKSSIRPTALPRNQR